MTERKGKEYWKRKSAETNVILTKHLVPQDDTLQSILNEIEENIPFFDIKMDHSRFVESCPMLLTLLYPEWIDVEFVQCKDGITNKLMKCTNRATNEVVLIRTYGKKSEILIDRSQELINLVTLSKRNLSPELIGRFQNGFIYGYVHGTPFSVQDMSDPVKSLLVARKLGKWHQIPLPGKKQSHLFETMQNWMDGLPDKYENSKTDSQYRESFKPLELSKEFSWLQQFLSKDESAIVFCHNDLLSGNIIYQHEENDVTFIDYEYGGFGFRGFDIANHFNEYAGFECDYSKCPDQEHQKVWLSTYLESFNDCPPTKEQVDSLLIEVAHFNLASHFYWGLWALIQAQFSDIAFDYMGYSVMRINEYYKAKKMIK